MFSKAQPYLKYFEILMLSGGPVSASNIASNTSIQSFFESRWFLIKSSATASFFLLLMASSQRCSVWRVFTALGGIFRRLRVNACLTNEASTEGRARCKPRKRRVSSTTSAPYTVLIEGEYDKTTQMGSYKSIGGKTAVHLLGPSVYSCVECRAHHINADGIISKSFQGRGGKAFLVDDLVNFWKGQPSERLLMTGMHSVADVYCSGCDALIGWTYEKAFEPSQKYKEGKFVLEKKKIMLDEV